MADCQQAKIKGLGRAEERRESLPQPLNCRLFSTTFVKPICSLSGCGSALRRDECLLIISVVNPPYVWRRKMSNFRQFGILRKAFAAQK